MSTQDLPEPKFKLELAKQMFVAMIPSSINNPLYFTDNKEGMDKLFDMCVESVNRGWDTIQEKK